MGRFCLQTLAKSAWHLSPVSPAWLISPRYPIDVCYVRLAWNINQPQSLRRKTLPHYIEFTTEDDARILVEVSEEETYQPGVVKAGLKDKMKETVVQAQTSFEDGLEVVRRNASAFIKKVRGLSDPPDEVEVTFGLKATGELGNFAVANVGAEASYTVTLKWKRETAQKVKPRRGTSRQPGS
jgi:hypothetical protein